MKVRIEALPYALFFGVAAAAMAAAGLYALAGPLLLLLMFTLFFFRDPEREFGGSSSALLAPADGKVIRAEEKDGQFYVSIFMSVFNVHVNRSPLSGKIEESSYFPGTYLAAYKDKASEENERQRWVVKGSGGSVEFVQIAGLVARRIHPLKNEGEALERAERFGLIAFGSRVDLRFDCGEWELLVTKGLKVRAGLTAIADRKNGK